jgi:hypothetical protein
VHCARTLPAVPLRIDRQVRTLDCLLLDDIPLWLVKVRPPRGNARAQEHLRYVQEYLIASIRSAFATLAGLPGTPSNTIEDLQELDAIEQQRPDVDRAAFRVGFVDDGYLA